MIFFIQTPKLCSNNGDMIGNPESYISLYPTNKNVMFKFYQGIKTNQLLLTKWRTKIWILIYDLMSQVKKVIKLSEEYDKKVEEWLPQRTSQVTK